MKKSASTVLLLATFACCFAAQLFAQGTDLGNIRGTVTDSSGGVVPGAAVEVADVDTNFVRKAVTNAAGDYEANGLKYGNYKVTVSMPGFSKAEVTGIALRSAETARADVRLATAGANQTVEVSAEAPVIETERQTITGTFDNRQVVELPRDSRDIYSFLYLNPNVTQADADGDFKFIGAQSYGASFSIDGLRSNGGIFGQPTSSEPSIEAVGELVVMSNDFTAEYAGIANIRIETKRGTSAFHGSAFYNNKNSALAAWNLRDKIAQTDFVPTPTVSTYPTPYFNENDIGGTLGGPIPHLKNTFFFAAYERDWNVAPVPFQSTTLPHPSLWGGDFSLVSDSKKPAVPDGIALTPAEIAADTVGGLGQQFIQIPQRLLNPVTQSLIQDYFPKLSATGYPINPSNGRLLNFYQNESGLAVRDLGTLRVDHDFSERDRASAIFNIQPFTSDNAPVVSPFTGLGLSQTQRMNYTLSLSETHLFSPAVVNEARGGFNKQDLLRRSNQTLQQFLSNIGFDQSDISAYGDVVGGTALDTYGHPAVLFGRSATLQGFTNGGRNTYRPQNQNLTTFGDTLTWVKGRHSLKFGGDLVRNTAVDGFAFNRGNPRGSMTYAGTGVNAFADFLLGLPPTTVTYVNAFRPPMDVANWEMGYFAQDDFKITPRLTVNFGLRYELATPFIESNDLLVNFDPDYINPTTGVKGRFVIPSSRTLAYLDPRFVTYGVVTADQAGLGRGLVHADTNNFAPRVGAAWRVTDKTVLRGGYGFYYPTSAAQGVRDAIGTNPFNQSLTKNGRTVPLEGWPGFDHGISPISGGTVQTVGSQPSANAIPFNLQDPRIDQFNVTFERELGLKTALRASYLGTRMHGLVNGIDLNMIKPSDNPFGTTTGDGVTACDPVNNGDCALSPADMARLPFPALGDYLLTYGNFGHGRSDALQLEFSRRFANGLMFDANYTLLSQKASAVDTGNSSLGGTAYNQFNPNNDFAVDSFVPRHRFIAYGEYDLPVGNNRKFGSSMPKWLDAIVGGWNPAWELFIKSGTAFTPYWVCDDCDPIAPGNIASGSLDALGDFDNNSYRPLVVGNPNKRSGDYIWDPSAFTVPTVGADALDNPQVAKRNTLYGPGTWGVNLGVHKVFRIGEKVRAEFGADINNLFNHPLFSPDEGGAEGTGFSQLGDFNVTVDPATHKLQPITDITPNPNFGLLNNSYSQDGVDTRRTVRLRLRIVF